MIWNGVTEMELSDYELIYCLSKTTFSKLNEQYEISLMSVKNYSDEICLEQLRSIKFLTTVLKLYMCERCLSRRSYKVFMYSGFCCTN